MSQFSGICRDYSYSLTSQHSSVQSWLEKGSTKTTSSPSHQRTNHEWWLETFVRRLWFWPVYYGNLILYSNYLFYLVFPPISLISQSKLADLTICFTICLGDINFYMQFNMHLSLYSPHSTKFLHIFYMSNPLE